MKRRNYKKLFGTFFLLCVIALNIYTLVGSNLKVSDSYLNDDLTSVFKTAKADTEGPYGNHMDGDSIDCLLWDNSCFCYLGGIRIWCLAWEGYCIETQCSAGYQ